MLSAVLCAMAMQVKCLGLRDRTFYSKEYFKTAPQSSFSRPCSYKQWEDISMVKAVSAVEDGTSIRVASEMFNVPRSTLHDRITGKVVHGSMSGPGRYLTVSEENELVSFLKKSCQIGYPRTRLQVLSLVQRALDKKAKDRAPPRQISSGWWDRFKQRHKGEITLRSPSAVSQVQATASNRAAIDAYYDILQSTLEENDLMDKPGLIFNLDETGMPLQAKGVKVIAEVGAKSVSHITCSTKNQITVMACVNAAGHFMPPFVIFDRKTLNPRWTKGEVPGTVYGLSSSGWSDTELFEEWFVNHFLRCAPKARPLLLLMDGHSSHFSPEMIRLAAKEKVILFVLPPHTTHLSQPLDKGCFSSLKVKWRAVCHEFVTANPGRVVTRADFSPLFFEAWSRSMTMKNIMSGFRVTGVYPFNREAISLPGEEKLAFDSEEVVRSSGLTYLPMYSPRPVRPVRVPLKEIEEEAPLKEIATTTEEYTILDNALMSNGCSQISELLVSPIVPSKQPKQRSVERVLTSADNLKKIQKKEEENRKRDEEKQKKAQERIKKAEICQQNALAKSNRKKDIHKQKGVQISVSGSEKVPVLVPDKPASHKSINKNGSGGNGQTSNSQRGAAKTDLGIAGDESLVNVSSTDGFLDENSIIVDESVMVTSSANVSLDDSVLCNWIGRLGLTCHDRSVLNSQACLSASHISAASKLLKLQYPSQSGLQDTAYLLQKSTWKSDSENFIQIIFVNSGHWACLSNIFCADEEVDLYDSAHTTPTDQDSIVKQVETILSPKKECQINLINVPLQYGGTDCGLFSIAFAVDLANNVDPARVRYSQPKMRAHLQHCFEKLKVKRFPSEDRQPRKRILCSFWFNINGHCAALSKDCQPESPSMYAQSKCSRSLRSTRNVLRQEPISQITEQEVPVLVSGKPVSCKSVTKGTGTKSGQASSQKRTVRIETGTDNSESEEEDSQCSAVPCTIESSGLMRPTWVACEKCGDWFHLFCVGLKTLPDTFFCDNC